MTTAVAGTERMDADVAAGVLFEAPSYGSDEFEVAMNEVTGHLNAQHARLVELTVGLLGCQERWGGVWDPHPGVVLGVAGRAVGSARPPGRGDRSPG